MCNHLQGLGNSFCTRHNTCVQKLQQIYPQQENDVEQCTCKFEHNIA